MTLPETTTVPAATKPPLLRIGRTFVHPLFDVLAIGGGLSLITAFGAWFGSGRESADAYWISLMPMLFLLSNSSHFAASTVRLYTKPGTFQALPFLTMAFPLVTLGVTTLALVYPGDLGRILNALYLAWSPFHYSAQAYGVALIYAYRSGCQISRWEKRMLWGGCMATFASTLVSSQSYESGIWWVLPASWVSPFGRLSPAVPVLSLTFSSLAYFLPLGLCALLILRGKPMLPLTSLLAVLTNSMWFTAFALIRAVMWSTVFHGIQYLAIVAVFHVKDQMSLPTNRHGVLYHCVSFYLMCLLLGYALFHCWPPAYEWLGFDPSQSAMLVIAAINIHHFIVDGYIWKLRKDPNYRIVTEAASAS